MFLFKRKKKTEFLAMFFRQLASMLSAGVPLQEALEILGEENESRETQRLARDVRDDLTKGEMMASTRKAYPAWFRAFLGFMMSRRSINEDLPSLMYSIADDHEAMEDLEARIFSSLMYPITVLGIALIVTGVVLIFVVPTFVELFASFGSSLPKPTLLTVKVSNWVVHHSTWIILALMAVVGALKYNKAFRDRVFIMIPGLGTIIKTHALIRFSRSLALMLGVNAPLQQAFDMAAEAAPNSIYSARFKDAFKNIENAGAICDALEGSGNYSGMAIRILRAGERSSSLSQALRGLAQYYEKSKMLSVEQTMRMFEIMVTIGVATLIGFLVISMYLPIFSMAGAVAG